MNIQINNLKKCFGEKVAVDINNFTVANGDIIGLVGNNGAGKTTLFRLILDLLKADEGEVILTPTATSEAINPAKSEDWKLFTGAYIDAGFLIDFLTAEEYFDFIGRVSGMNKAQVAERIAHFEPFMNGEVLNQKKYIRDFSAGNKHKVGIIAALFNSPELVVLDEPFNYLDPSSQNMLKKMLKEYNRQTGATIIVSSHNLQHTIEVSTRIALLEHGRIIKDLNNSDESAIGELESYFEV